MSAAPAKFLFNDDMGEKEQKKPPEITEAQLREMVEAAKLEGHAQGLQEGQNSVTAQAANELAKSARSIVQSAANLLSQTDAAEKTIRADAILLARSVGKKLATELFAQQPTVELGKLLEECLSSIEKTPHLVIRCAPDLTEHLQEIAEPLIASSGYAGRLIVMGDPEIGPSDGRIEWADGGLVRDATEINSQIDGAIQSYLAARGITPQTEAQP